MEAATVVEAFEVIEDGGVGLGLGWEDAFFGEQFAFDRSKEAFGKRVVLAITDGTHALLPAQTLEQSTGGAGAVLAAAIGVEDGLRCDQSGVEGAAQGGGDQAAFHRLGQFPAQDATREQIENDDQIKPALAGRDVSDVADQMRAGHLR